MKKMIPALAIISALLIPSVSLANNTLASGVKIGVGYDLGPSVVMQFNNRLNLAIGDDGIAIDVLLSKGGFNGGAPFTWYIGGGGWSKWNDHGDDFGLRLPLGLEWNFASGWDLYGQFHPELAFNNRDNGKGDNVNIQTGMAFGIRYQF